MSTLADVLNPNISPSRTGAGKVSGVVTAVVVSIDDPEGLGRVKVSFPWLEDNQESHWARVSNVMAGNDRGTLFRPDVNDEVLVLFEHGDMRFPYVIGALWNGKDKPPSEGGADADNHVKVIKSRSGHTIVMDDTPGAENIKISDQSGNSVELSSEGIVISGTNIKLGSSGASEGMVLGDAFMDLFNNHIHPTGVGPSGPPTTPMIKGAHVSASHTVE